MKSLYWSFIHYTVFYLELEKESVLSDAVPVTNAQDLVKSYCALNISLKWKILDRESSPRNKQWYMDHTNHE